jgi:hypothetical protein
MNQGAGLTVRELKKCNHQTHKAGDRYYIEESRHIPRNTKLFAI